MSNFETVTIGYDEVGEKITIDKPNIQLNFVKGPNSIQWVIESQPPEAMGVEINFKGESPFNDIGMSINGGTRKLIATGNRCVRCRFEYWVRFFGSDGEVIAELDPGGDNNPDPPEYPTFP